MLTADGPGGNWSFTYNSQDLPTTIVEPYGTLNVQYGIDGNITQMVNQPSFTTNYLYDAVGRLAKLTDAGGNLIELYSYDQERRDNSRHEASAGGNRPDRGCGSGNPGHERQTEPNLPHGEMKRSLGERSEFL